MFWNEKSVVELDKLGSLNSKNVRNYDGYNPKITWLKKNWRTLGIRVILLIWLILLGWYIYAFSNNDEYDLAAKLENSAYNEPAAQQAANAKVISESGNLANTDVSLGGQNANGNGAEAVNNAQQFISNYIEQLLPPPHKDFDKKYLVHADNYDTLIKKFGLPRILKDFTFQERCDIYFKMLYMEDPNWKIDPGFDYIFDRGGINGWPKYLDDKSKEYKKKQAEELKVDESTIQITEEFKNEMKAKYEALRIQTFFEEQKMHNTITNVKLFNKCYLSKLTSKTSLTDAFIRQQKLDLQDLPFESKDSNFVGLDSKDRANFKKYTFNSCGDLESRIYPWLSKKLPTFTRWDGTVLKDQLPRMCKYIDGLACDSDYKRIPTPVKSSLTGGQACFLDHFKSQLNGQGLAMTINEGPHLEISIRLIRLLRSLDTNLPLQIVFNDPISQEAMDQMVKAARTEFYDQNGRALAELELWFVDVREALSESDRGRFGGYSNKILATLFNSFSEMMLLDADTVIVQPPEYFFNLPKFKQHGTLFFKDRNALERRPKDDTLFFRKLMPSDMDTIFFNFPQITGYTLDRNFFQGINHYMESGLVMINKRRHFTQAFMMTQLNFIRPANGRIYGDKELFWLAMTLIGDESYYFNKLACAAIGIETPESERVNHAPKGKTSFKSREICSNHPAHINGEDEHTLLWFNSGFQFCGQVDKVDFVQDFNQKFRYMLMESVEQFTQVMKGKIIIKEAVVPPDNIDLGLEAKNDEHEPDRGWINPRMYCNGYTWCAYSSIGGNLMDSIKKEMTTSMQSGYFIQFNEDEIARTGYLGDVWMSEFDFRSNKRKQEDLKKAQEDKEKAAKEKKEKEEKERKEKEEKEKTEKEVAAKKAAEEAEKRTKEEAAKKAKEEVERKEREEKERKQKEAQDKQLKEAAEASNPINAVNAGH